MLFPVLNHSVNLGKVRVSDLPPTFPNSMAMGPNSCRMSEVSNVLREDLEIIVENYKDYKY